MKRPVTTILLLAVLASACAGDASPEATDGDTTTATAPAANSETTAASTTTTVTTVVEQHAFDQYVWDEFRMESMAVQDTDTGEWLDSLPPAAGIAEWYCSDRFPARNSAWSYTFDGPNSPEAIQSYDSWKAEFWDKADEMVCLRAPEDPSDTAAQTSTPAAPDAAAELGSQIVGFFYPGFELDYVVAGGSDAIRMVAKSVANPGFQIAFDAARADIASEGCDFVYEPTGETWCHSTAPSGLEMLAGRQAMVPASHLVGIEADLAALDLVITDFELNSNVAITLLGIAPSSLESWDGDSSEQAISMSLDIASGTWRQN